MAQEVPFFSHPIFVIMSGFVTLFTISGFVYLLVGYGKGIIPILWRQGMGLWRREIAIFATGDNLRNLRNTLLKSDLFSEKRIREISSNDFADAKDKSVYLVDWKTFSENKPDIFKILEGKQPQTAVIVFCEPPDRIDSNYFNKIARYENTAISTARGRLLNDIITAFITTSYNRGGIR
jgi:hypothetical protein